MYITVHHHNHTSDVSMLLPYLCIYFIAIQATDEADEGLSSSDDNNKCKADCID